MNPLSLVAMRNYYADLTHAQPLVPETLVLLARQAGFGSTELRFLNEPPRSTSACVRSNSRRSARSTPPGSRSRRTWPG